MPGGGGNRKGGSSGGPSGSSSSGGKSVTLAEPLLGHHPGRGRREPSELDVQCASVHVYNATLGLHENHKTDRRSLETYMFCQSARYKVCLFAVVVVHLFLAALEQPALLDGVPEGATAVAELLILVFYGWDLSMRTRYLVDRRRLVKDKKYLVVLVSMSLIFFDLAGAAIAYISTGVRAVRWSRPIRPWFLIYAYQPLRLVVRDLRRTLPDVVEVLAFLFGVLSFFAVVFFVLFNRIAAEVRVANSTADLTAISFDTFPHSVVSTYVLLTTANFPDVMMPAYNRNRFYSIFFVAFLVIVLYLIMSLVLAIFYIKYRYHLKVEVKRLLVMHGSELERAWQRLDPGRTGTIPLATWQRFMRRHRPGVSNEMLVLSWDLLRTSSKPLSARLVYNAAVAHISAARAPRRGALALPAQEMELHGLDPPAAASQIVDRPSLGGDSGGGLHGSSSSSSATTDALVSGPGSSSSVSSSSTLSTLSSSSSSSSSSSTSSSAPAASPAPPRMMPPMFASSSGAAPTLHQQSLVRSAQLASSRTCRERGSSHPQPDVADDLREAASEDGGMTFAEFSKIVDVLSAEVRARPRLLTRYDTWYRRPVDTAFKRAIVHPWFDYLVVLGIVANAVAIVFDASHAGDRPEVNALLTMTAFSLLFVIEVILRIYAVGLRYFASEWNRLDVVVLALSLIDVVFMAAVYAYDASLHEESRRDWVISAWQAGVAVRLVRLACGFGKIRRFRVIIETLIEIGPLLITCGLLQFVLYYAFAVVGMEAFGGRMYADNPALAHTGYLAQGYLRNNFDDISLACTTLFEVMVVNQWHVLAGGFIAVTSEWAWLYFVSFHLGAVVINLNIIVALVLEAFVLLFKIKGEESSAMERLRGRLRQIELATNDAENRGYETHEGFFGDGSTAVDRERAAARASADPFGSKGSSSSSNSSSSKGGHAAAADIHGVDAALAAADTAGGNSDGESEASSMSPSTSSSSLSAVLVDVAPCDGGLPARAPRWRISLRRNYNAFIQQLFLAELQQGTTVGIEAPGASFGTINSRTEIALDLLPTETRRRLQVKVSTNVDSPLFATASSHELRTPHLRSRHRRKTWLPEDPLEFDDEGSEL
jgi:hypothetical protein